MSVNFKRRERDRLAIVAEILEMARHGMPKSNIMDRARLSYYMLNGYLELMMNTKLLDKSSLDKREMFRTTDRGLKLLYYCYEIIKLLEPENIGKKMQGGIQLLPAKHLNILRDHSLKRDAIIGTDSELNRYSSEEHVEIAEPLPKKSAASFCHNLQ